MYQRSNQRLLEAEVGISRHNQSFLPQQCVILPMSQTLHFHYLAHHLSNIFAYVFSDSPLEAKRRESTRRVN